MLRGSLWQGCGEPTGAQLGWVCERALCVDRDRAKQGRPLCVFVYTPFVLSVRVSMLLCILYIGFQFVRRLPPY